MIYAARKIERLEGSVQSALIQPFGSLTLRRINHQARPANNTKSILMQSRNSFHFLILHLISELDIDIDIQLLLSLFSTILIFQLDDNIILHRKWAVNVEFLKTAFSKTDLVEFLFFYMCNKIAVQTTLNKHQIVLVLSHF